MSSPWTRYILQEGSQNCSSGTYHPFCVLPIMSHCRAFDKISVFACCQRLKSGREGLRARLLVHCVLKCRNFRSVWCVADPHMYMKIHVKFPLVFSVFKTQVYYKCTHTHKWSLCMYHEYCLSSCRMQGSFPVQMAWLPLACTAPTLSHSLLTLWLTTKMNWGYWSILSTIFHWIDAGLE